MMQEDTMRRVDRGDARIGTSSESTARVAAYRRFDCKLALTLECSYVGCSRSTGAWMGPADWEGVGVAAALAMYDTAEKLAFKGVMS